MNFPLVCPCNSYVIIHEIVSWSFRDMIVRIRSVLYVSTICIMYLLTPFFSYIAQINCPQLLLSVLNFFCYLIACIKRIYAMFLRTCIDFLSVLGGSIHSIYSRMVVFNNYNSQCSNWSCNLELMSHQLFKFDLFLFECSKWEVIRIQLTFYPYYILTHTKLRWKWHLHIGFCAVLFSKWLHP